PEAVDEHAVAIRGRRRLVGAFEPHVHRYSFPPCTITSGQDAWWARCRLTEPSRSAAKPPSPRDPRQVARDRETPRREPLPAFPRPRGARSPRRTHRL